MSSTVIAPDERALREHLSGGRFRAGVAARRWRLIELDWPFAVIAVSAAERPDSPEEFALRLELNGYPHSPPGGQLWDVAIDSCLPADRHPKGARAAVIFRTDGSVATAMYAPWDRFGLQAHPDWAQTYPLLAWNPSRDLSFILINVHEVLNADDYLGV